MLPPLPRCSGWAYSSLISPSRVSLPRKGHRVGLHIVLFEACSAFTRVAACTLARSPYFVTRYPKASDISSPPCLLRLLPAGAIAGWDLHPLESAAFARCTPEADTGTHPSRLYALEGISIAPQLALAATADVVRGRDLEAPRRSERAKELNQIPLLLAGQLGAEHQIEELDRIIERQQAPVMQIGRRILDAAQREGLDGSVAALTHAVDHLRLEEALGLEIVHQVVGVIGRGVAGPAPAFAEEDLLAAQFGLRGLGRIEPAEYVKLRCRRETKFLLKFRHQPDLA